MKKVWRVRVVKKFLPWLLILVLVVSMLSVSVLAAAPVSSPEDMSATPVGPTSPQTGVEGNLFVLAAVAMVVLCGTAVLLKKSFAK